MLSTSRSLLALCLAWLCLSRAFLVPPHRPRTSLFKAAAKKNLTPPPEFSRIVPAAQVTERRPVLCKILAKEPERKGLAERFDVFQIGYFAANITVTRTDSASLLVEGKIEAHIKDGELLEPFIVKADFDTLVLDGSAGGVSFEEATDYDEEIGPGGELDIGEIAAQYLSMELF